MKSDMIRISKTAKFKIQEIEVDNDHIQLLINSVPQISGAQIVRKLKQESTISAWKQFPELLKKQF